MSTRRRRWYTRTKGGFRRPRGGRSASRPATAKREIGVEVVCSDAAGCVALGAGGVCSDVACRVALPGVAAVAVVPVPTVATQCAESYRPFSPEPRGATHTSSGPSAQSGGSGTDAPRAPGATSRVWHRGLAQAQCHRLEVAPGARGASLPLPPDWAEGPLDVWVAPRGAGEKGRYDSAHCVATVDTGTTTAAATPESTTRSGATRHATSLQTTSTPISRFAVAGRLADLPPRGRRKPPFVRVYHRRLRVDIYSGPRRR